MECPPLAKVSGTDASKSRYREFSSGILDSVQRELLMMRLVPWLSLEQSAGDIRCTEDLSDRACRTLDL